MQRHTIDIILLAVVMLIIGHLSIATAQQLQTACSEPGTGMSELCETYGTPPPRDSGFTWFNFRTNKPEQIIGLPNNLEDYIPRIPPAINMYRVYIDMGKTPMEAYELVMKAIVDSK